MARLKAWMIASYPHQEATGEVQRCWTADWSEVIAKYGMDMLVAALKLHRKASSYMPTAHDLDVQIGILREQRVAAFAAKDAKRIDAELAEAKARYDEETAAGRTLYHRCEDCDGTGMHWTDDSRGRRVLVSVRKGSCPTCKGECHTRQQEAA